MTTHPGTPYHEGFRMPGEFGPHAGCLMAWPRKEAVFPGRLDQARQAYVQVARSIHGFEPVVMIAHPEDAADAAMMLGPGIEVWPIPIDDSWARDTGPTFVLDSSGRVGGIQWRFNGWGGVWPDFDLDARLAQNLLDRLDLPSWAAPVVLEGGAIHVDGQGTLMAVLPCLLDPRRNPGFSREEMERTLTDYLGVTRFIWLDHGLDNDETGGHVDNVACFIRPGVVAVQTAQDPADPNRRTSLENLARLRSARDAAGRPLEVIEIEQPALREGKDGRLALSYINFYPANGGVVMPSFGDPMDQAARETLARLFPDRRLVQIPALDILHGGGGIHCITQQRPFSGPTIS
jgi:agmatine deiminase